MKGTSTGQPEYNKRKAQKREMDKQNQSIHGNYSSDLKPTPEQIEKKRKRDELDAKRKARLDKKAEKRRKGRPKFDFECKHCGFKTKHRNVALAHVRSVKGFFHNVSKKTIFGDSTVENNYSPDCNIFNMMTNTNKMAEAQKKMQKLYCAMNELGLDGSVRQLLKHWKGGKTPMNKAFQLYLKSERKSKKEEK